jgi:soluble lytic murein transglycosylase-like protein
MRKGQRLVIQGAILGSLLIVSLAYFASAGATPLDNQPQKPGNSQELKPSPSQPVNQQNLSQAQPLNQDILSPVPAFQDSFSQSQPTPATPASSETVPTEAAKKQQTPPSPKKQKPKCQVNSSYPEKILQWCQLISRYASKYNLDPNLIAALILQESGGNPQAYSPSGAVGLMQVMPNDGLAAGFMCPTGPCFAKRPSIQELQDPEFNIDYGVRMLAALVNKYGNIRDGLKAYGPGNVGYYYVNKVMAIYNNYRRAG